MHVHLKIFNPALAGSDWWEQACKLIFENPWVVASVSNTNCGQTDKKQYLEYWKYGLIVKTR